MNGEQGKRILSASELALLKNGANNLDKELSKEQKNDKVIPPNVVTTNSEPVERRSAGGLGGIVELMIADDPTIKREEIPYEKLTEGRQIELKPVSDEEKETASVISSLVNNALEGENVDFGKMDDIIKRAEESRGLDTVKVEGDNNTPHENNQTEKVSNTTPEIDETLEKIKEGKIDEVDFDDISKKLTNIENKTNGMTKEKATENVVRRFGQDALDIMKESFNEYARDFKEVMDVYESTGMTGNNNNSIDAVVEDNASSGGVVSITESIKKLATNSNVVSDIIKNLRKRGTSAVGYLPSTNIMVRVYSIDSPFVKEKIQREFQNYNLTGFRDRNLLIEILSRTEVLAKNADFEADELEKVIHLADLDDLIMIALQASNQAGIIKSYPMICQPYTQEEYDAIEADETIDEAVKSKTLKNMMDYDCNKKYKCDIDTKEVIASAVTKEILDGAKSYSRIKSIDTLINEGVAGKEYQALYGWEEKQYDVSIELIPPTLADYFGMVADIKLFIIEEMKTKEHVIRYIAERDAIGKQNGMPPMHIESIDTQLRELALTFRNEVSELSETTQLLIYIKSISLYPFEYSRNNDAKIEDYLDTIITLTKDTHSLADIKSLIMDLPGGVLHEIYEVVNKMELDEGRPNRSFTSICPHCGKRNKDEFIPSALFFGWALQSLKNLTESKKSKK